MIVYLGGDRWDRVSGTDKRIVKALAESGEVLWVDPPYPMGMSGRPSRLSIVSPGLSRLVPIGLPMSSRAGVRPMAEAWAQRMIRRGVAAAPGEVEAVIVASARATFPKGLPGERVLYVSDDWVEGAELMGLDRTWVEHRLRNNVAAATKVCAISPGLVDRLADYGARHVELLPNGCEPAVDVDGRSSVAAAPVAALIGQLNERLDLTMLDAVADRGVRLKVVGPRMERDPVFSRRLDAFLARENVAWTREVDASEIPGILSTCAVGLTPYTLSKFNRSSFPLKTLEYIANGLPVVSTDLPAARWLGTDAISIAHGPEHFADLVARAVESAPSSRSEIARRIGFARSHSWTQRATRLREIISG